MVNKQVEEQITKMQHHHDKLGRAALARLEEKVSATENRAPAIDRRLAELSGSYKGLTEEVTHQIDKVNQLEDRLLEFKQQMERDFRQKICGLEEQVGTMNSAIRVKYDSLEDMHKKYANHNLRLQKIESDHVHVQHAHGEMHDVFQEFHSRLEAVERREVPVPEFPRQQDDKHTEQLLSVFHKSLGDLNQKVDKVVDDSQELHALSNSHQTQLMNLRKQFELREANFRSLLGQDKDKADIDAKLDKLKIDLHHHTSGKEEQLILLGNRIAHNEVAHEELRKQLHNQICELQLAGHSPFFLHAADTADTAMGADSAPPSPSRSLDAGQFGFRLEQAEVKIQCVEKLLVDRGAEGFNERVGELIYQMQGLAPQVIDLENRLKSDERNIQSLQARMDRADQLGDIGAKVRDKDSSGQESALRAELDVIKEASPPTRHQATTPIRSKGVEEAASSRSGRKWPFDQAQE
jgi:myosin heavy subunit